MERIKITAIVLADLVKRTPEGFLRLGTIQQHYILKNKEVDALLTDLATLSIMYTDLVFFDALRITLAQLQQRSMILSVLPNAALLAEAPIAERVAERAKVVQDLSAVAQTIFREIEAHCLGYLLRTSLKKYPNAATGLHELFQHGILQPCEDFVYDPLRVRLTQALRDHIATDRQIEANRMKMEEKKQHYVKTSQKLQQFLEACPGKVYPAIALCKQFGDQFIDDSLQFGDIQQLEMAAPSPPRVMRWITLATANDKEARTEAQRAIKATEGGWVPFLERCGTVMKPNAREGVSARMKAIARTYKLSEMPKCLGVPQKVVEQAVHARVLISLLDPQQCARIPVYEVERMLVNPELFEKITAFHSVRIRSIALACDVGYSTAWRRVKRDGLTPTRVTWGDVRGKWGLPTMYQEFIDRVQPRMDLFVQTMQKSKQDKIDSMFPELRRVREERDLLRIMRRDIREKLVASFPTWQHDGRDEQCVYWHCGPTNSGKTHAALTALTDAGSGWYLAPLRLLAFEVFDRLNNRGVPCNLLTGEEEIQIAGATITAATIEMFQPSHSGDVVVIDEAQMLADSERGWAWTRALMEARASHIHILGPAIATSVIERLTQAAALELQQINHTRLTPLHIAEMPWSLAAMPPRTIVVVFSRRLALELKTLLESMGRTVSTIYGNLPPEVRRYQADRFARGETEICVATDAVGMGLNLPADHVCFFETSKFDGVRMRLLTTQEVQQIGGRAGRFGFSENGFVGAVTSEALKFIRELFHQPATTLTHARVAPSVQDLQLIPGSLATKLSMWMQWQSIPELLRDTVCVADMRERIELANMLTYEEQQQLGLAAAIRLTNAPTRRFSRFYWRSCVAAILAHNPMPTPNISTLIMKDHAALEAVELSVACADLYLWLARPPEFQPYGPENAAVRERRYEWSLAIDDALQQRIDTRRRCRSCGRHLPQSHRYALCESCYQDHRYARNSFDNDW